MDSRENQPKPNGTNNFALNWKLKPSLLCFSSILIIFIAILIGLTSTDFNKLHLLRSSLSLNTTLIQTLLGFLSLTQNPSLTQMQKPISDSPHCVLWMAPFLSGGGYSSEAWSYILSLHEHMKAPGFKMGINQHGDLQSVEFWNGLPQHVRNLAVELHQTDCNMNETIVVCHSEPGAWYPPLFQTPPCPPIGYGRFKFSIGRTMFETDRVNPEHVKRCNQMDYVWVPTEFHVSTFIKSGVDPSKVIKIVQPVDVEFFDPVKYQPLDIASIGKLVLGSETPEVESKKEFIFLSIFKWEYRKGWDVLLKSYLKEFSGSDGVVLYLLTNPFHSTREFGNKIIGFVDDSDLEKPVDGWARVYVIDTHIAQTDLPRVYKAADAFVLPSRGEGWGRPAVEAMSMALPVIATNWSGPTEYLTDENSYPLQVEKMSEVTEGPFQGHLWAEPCVSKLQNLMRHVVSNIEEARVKGGKAREDMIGRFSPELVAGIVADHFQTLLNKKV